MPSPYHSSPITLPPPSQSSAESLCTMKNSTSGASSRTSVSLLSAKLSRFPTWFRNLTKKPPTTALSKSRLTTTLSRRPSPDISKPTAPSPNTRPSENPINNLGRGLSRSISRALGRRGRGRGRGRRHQKASSQPLCPKPTAHTAPAPAPTPTPTPRHCSDACWCRDLGVDIGVRVAWEELFPRAHDSDFDFGGADRDDGSSVYYYYDDDDDDEVWVRGVECGEDAKTDDKDANMDDESGTLDGNSGDDDDGPADAEDRGLVLLDYTDCVVEAYGRMAEWRRDC